MMKCTTTLCILYVCALISVGYGASCIVDEVPVQKDFDMHKFQGKWYEQRWHTGGAEFPIETRSVDYYFYYVPTQTEVTNYIGWRFPVNNTCYIYHESLTRTETPGKYLRNTTTKDGITQLPYVITDTDYTQYAFIYECKNVSSDGTCNGARAWMFSRTPKFPQIIKDKAAEFYNKVCLLAENFLDANHTKACDLPEQYRVCPEQTCNVSTVQVQHDFDRQKYSGSWYEMRWLMQPDVPLSMVLKNYQQELVLESSGKMTAYSRGRLSKCVYTKDILEQSQTPGKYSFSSTTLMITYPYWVVDTDYENFAVLYGCRNISTNGECAQTQASIWSRRPHLAPFLQDRANTVLQGLCVNLAAFRSTPQDKACPPKWAEAVCPTNKGRNFMQNVYTPFLLTIMALIRG